MAEIDIIDQALRDGQQSLWGMRMKVAHIAGITDDIERAGYRVVDLTGSSIFECMMRYNREDPWDGLDLWRSWMPTSRLRSGSRSNCIAKFGLTPDSLMELWIRTLAKHGIDSFWIYDCLYNMVASIPEDRLEELRAQIPVGRFSAPSEVGPAVGFLASEEAGYITGVVLPVDGGLAI